MRLKCQRRGVNREEKNERLRGKNSYPNLTQVTLTGEASMPRVEVSAKAKVPNDSSENAPRMRE